MKLSGILSLAIALVFVASVQAQGPFPENEVSLRALQLQPHRYAGQILTFSNMELLNIGKGWITFASKHSLSLHVRDLNSRQQTTHSPMNTPQFILHPSVADDLLPYLETQTWLNITGTVLGEFNFLKFYSVYGRSPYYNPSAINWVFFIDSIQVVNAKNVEQVRIAIEESPMKQSLANDVNRYFFGSTLLNQLDQEKLRERVVGVQARLLDLEQRPERGFTQEIERLSLKLNEEWGQELTEERAYTIRAITYALTDEGLWRWEKPIPVLAIAQAVAQRLKCLEDRSRELDKLGESVTDEQWHALEDVAEQLESDRDQAMIKRNIAPLLRPQPTPCYQMEVSPRNTIPSLFPENRAKKELERLKGTTRVISPETVAQRLKEIDDRSRELRRLGGKATDEQWTELDLALRKLNKIEMNYLPGPDSPEIQDTMKQLTEGFKWTTPLPVPKVYGEKTNGKMPTILSSSIPIYPQESKQANEEGVVEIRVLIDSAGMPTNPSVSKSSGFPALDQSALEAISTWKFSPAQDGTGPVEKWITIPIVFELETSEIDQPIAKLSIPEITPLKSIGQRLQLLEVPASEGQGESTTKPSSGKNLYLAIVEETIDRKWIAPSMPLDNNLVVAKFRIFRSGEISAIELTNRSGVEEYDDAVTTAIRSAGPFPPFPASITADEFKVIYQFIKD